MTAPKASSHQDVDSHSRGILNAYAAKHGGEARLGCSLVAHRDLGLCAGCAGPEREVACWRLLAMAERGIPLQTWEKAASGSVEP